MPVTGGLLVGRDEELRQLDQLWNTPHCKIVTLVAWAGVGKSTLVNHWVRRMARDGYRGADRVFAWSFYRQGTVDRVMAADEFIRGLLDLVRRRRTKQRQPQRQRRTLGEAYAAMQDFLRFSMVSSRCKAPRAQTKAP